jgi:hypothetical protein
MDPHRQYWNAQQKMLQQALARPDEHARAVDLFLSQHAMLHASAVSHSGLWSFDDEVWADLPAETARRIPRGGEHSIAWALWHIARIEDITMNYLIAGTPQLLLRAGWHEKLGAAACDTGNAMPPAAIAQFSAEIDLPALRAYRSAVGQRTREILQQQPEGALRQPVDPDQLRQILLDGAVVPDAAGLLEYWGSKTKGSLLLMPPTRHNFLHLNEALRLKAKRN